MGKSMVENDSIEFVETIKIVARTHNGLRHVLNIVFDNAKIIPDETTLSLFSEWHKRSDIPIPVLTKRKAQLAFNYDSVKMIISNPDIENKD